MKWSQLKKRIEATFADAVAGRVEVWNTRYRKSHDAEGEAWITIDGQRVWSMGTYAYLMESWRELERRPTDLKCAESEEADQRGGVFGLWGKTHRAVQARGVFALPDMNRALFEYLSLSIDDAISSENPVLRAFAMLDRRFGKRRLLGFDASRENPLVQALYRFRCEAEGVAPLGDAKEKGAAR